MPIAELLLAHKEFIVILVLLVGVFLGFSYVKVLHSEINALKSKNVVLETNLVTSNNSIKTLEASITEQNSAVDKLKTAADQQQHAHAVEIAAANSRAETYRQQALDILRAKPQDADKCKSANDLINQEIGRNVKK